jgi:hypothetical protein
MLPEVALTLFVWEVDSLANKVGVGYFMMGLQKQRMSWVVGLPSSCFDGGKFGLHFGFFCLNQAMVDQQVECLWQQPPKLQ